MSLVALLGTVAVAEAASYNRLAQVMIYSGAEQRSEPISSVYVSLILSVSVSVSLIL